MICPNCNSRNTNQVESGSYKKVNYPNGMNDVIFEKMDELHICNDCKFEYNINKSAVKTLNDFRSLELKYIKWHN